jgi:Rieske Fe-S protein
VYFRRAREDMLCPCHDGVFDAKSGLVLAGPPQRPLPRIAIERRDDGFIWALGEEVDDGSTA